MLITMTTQWRCDDNEDDNNANC